MDRRLWLIAAILIATGWCGLASGQVKLTNQDLAQQLTSPNPQLPVVAATDTILNTVPHSGDAPLGITINELTDQVLVVDLFSGTTWTYDRLLNSTGSIPSPGGIDTMTGIAWASNTNTLFWIDATAVLLYETDEFGAIIATNSLAPAPGALVGGLCYRGAGAGPDTLVGDDIVNDEYFEFDRLGVNTGFVFPNPDDAGTGAFGNGISHDAGDGFHIATGTITEAQVSRMYDLDTSGTVESVLWDVANPNPGNFDTFVNGHVYTPLGGTLLRPAEYIVGNASNIIVEMDGFGCQLGPITGLACTVVGDDVEMTWTNGDTYTQVEVTRDGTVIATLAGTATSYTDVAPPLGTHNYIVGGSDAVNCGDGDTCSIFVLGGATDLIWAHADQASGLTNSATAINDALSANGVLAAVVDTLPPDVTIFDRVWVVLGTFPDDHILTDTEAQTLVDGNISGVPLLIEGGDTWGFAPQTVLAGYDGVQDGASADGDDSCVQLTGADSGFGVDFTGLDAAYTQDQAGNDWTDQLFAAANDLGGPDAGTVWIGGDGVITYNVGIFYSSLFAPVISQSFEFGGYGGDQVILMAEYLGALVPCPVDAPSALTCVETAGNVDLTWTNNGTYTDIKVNRDAVEIATIAGSATSYSDVGAPLGIHTYTVRGEDSAVGCGRTSAACSLLVGDFTDLVWAHPDQAGGLVDSATAVVNAISANGGTPLLLQDLPADVSPFERIWAVTGTYPMFRELSAAEGQTLADASIAGKPVYLEGGDFWGFAGPNPFWDYDGVADGAVDGDDSFTSMVGTDSGFGQDMTGMDAGYTQDNAGNDWTDQIQASTTDLGGPESGVIWMDGTSTYNTGIYYNSTFGPVICQSWEFGGYQGDQIALMGVYISGPCPLNAPTGLICAESNGDVDMTWSNGDTYTDVRVFRNNVEIAALPGTATSYTDAAAPIGQHSYTVRGEDSALGCGRSAQPCDVQVGDFTDLVWAPPAQAGGLVDSATAIVNALDANSVLALQVGTLPADLSAWTRVWVIAGTFPLYHSLTATEAQSLVDANVAGISIYTEGGDFWGFSPPNAFWPYDGVEDGTALDGDDGFTAMTGTDSTFGMDMTGLDAPYNQDNAGNDWTDRIQPAIADLGGPDSGVIWQDSDEFYNTGVFYSSTLAPNISQSWEFGGYGGDQNALMALYVAALGGSPPPPIDPFVRGDTNADGGVNIGDAVFLLSALFVPGSSQPTCADSADVNDDGQVNIGDAVYELSALFVPGATPIPEPSACGVDPTDDGVDCAAFGPCP